MTDNYEYNKSLEPQDINDSTPFADKQWLYMPDLNNGVYQQSNTLIQFNAQNIYNSQKFISSDMFFVIPVQMVAGIYGPSTGAVGTNEFASLDISGNNYPWWSLLSMKQGNHNLIHQAEIIVDDHNLQQLMSHINISTHFQLLSRMSQDDLKHYGSSVGFEDELDNERSIKYNNNQVSKRVNAVTAGVGFTTTALEGNGVTNNRIFSNSNINSPAVIFAPSSDGGAGRLLTVNNNNYATNHQLQLNRAQNYDCINLAKNKQLNRYSVITSDGLDSFNDIVGNGDGFLIDEDGLKKNYVPTVQLVNNKQVLYNDYIIVRLKDLYNSIEQIPLCRRFNAKINLYLNTGQCSTNIQMVCTATNTLGGFPLYFFDGSHTTFSNTMPYNHNYIPKFPLVTVTSAVANTVYDYTFISGLFIKKAQPFSMQGWAGVNSSGAATKQISMPELGISHPLPSCRLYYSQQLLHPKEALKYVEGNRNKRIVYRDVLLNQDNNIPPGQYSKLINAGIKNPIGLLIVPMIAKTSQPNYDPALVTTYHNYNFSQYQSPFDTCPNNFVLSLTQLNSTLGGINVLQQNLDLVYENFLEQIVNVDSLTSSDYGISNGLLNQKYVQNGYRNYYISLDRTNPADKAIGRSLSVSFNNNSKCPVDILYFIYYMKEVEIDVQSGIISPV
jgi:hypothetical protein